MRSFCDHTTNRSNVKSGVGEEEYTEESVKNSGINSVLLNDPKDQTFCVQASDPDL